MWLGLTSCMYFLSLLYCSISNKSHVQTILVIVICFHQMFHISPFLSETTKKIVWLCLWCFTCYFWDTRVIDFLPYHISTASASMLILSAVAVYSSPCQVKPKTKIDICCFSVKHAVFRSKSKDWFSQNQIYESKWSDMSTRWQLFQWTVTIKI